MADHPRPNSWMEQRSPGRSSKTANCGRRRSPSELADALPGRRARGQRSRFGHLRQDEAGRCERIRRRFSVGRVTREQRPKKWLPPSRTFLQTRGSMAFFSSTPFPRASTRRAAFEAIVPGQGRRRGHQGLLRLHGLRLPGFASCTPGGIMRLLDEYDVHLTGKHAVVIGRSPILGKPIGMLLLARDATVTYCHSRTEDLPAIVRTADIVVAAVGRPALRPGRLD